MVKEFSLGQMAGNTMESTMMIRKKASAFSFGQTVEDTKEAGSMESNMDLVFILLQKQRLRKESGKTVKE